MRYRAFISFANADRRISQKLLSAIERYKVPKAFRDVDYGFGHVPQRLAPVFRDSADDEPASGPGRQAYLALTESDALIVLCTPDAARSAWVDNEIRTFKSFGRNNRIIPVLVAGVPKRYDANDQPDGAFPPALFEQLDANGQVIGEELEPLAIDLRDAGDRLHLGTMEIVSQLTGIPSADLYRSQRAEQRERRLSILGLLIPFHLLLCLFAWVGSAVPGGAVAMYAAVVLGGLCIPFTLLRINRELADQQSARVQGQIIRWFATGFAVSSVFGCLVAWLWWLSMTGRPLPASFAWAEWPFATICVFEGAWIAFAIARARLPTPRWLGHPHDARKAASPWLFASVRAIAKAPALTATSRAAVAVVCFAAAWMVADAWLTGTSGWRTRLAGLAWPSAEASPENKATFIVLSPEYHIVAIGASLGPMRVATAELTSSGLPPIPIAGHASRIELGVSDGSSIVTVDSRGLVRVTLIPAGRLRP